MSFSPPQFDIHSKYVTVRLTNNKCSSVTYVTQDGIWTAFSHPLLPSHWHIECGNAPNAPRATSYPRQQHNTFAFLPSFSNSTLIKIFQKNHDSLSLIRAPGLPTPALPDYPLKKKNVYFQTLPPKFMTHAHMHAYLDRSGFMKYVARAQLAMVGLGTSTQTIFSFGIFFLDLL